MVNIDLYVYGECGKVEVMQTNRAYMSPFWVSIELAEAFERKREAHGGSKTSALAEAMKLWAGFDGSTMVEGKEQLASVGGPQVVEADRRKYHKMPGWEMRQDLYLHMENRKGGRTWKSVLNEAAEMWLASRNVVVDTGRHMVSATTSQTAPVSPMESVAPVVPELTAEELAEANRVKWEEQHKTWLARKTEQLLETAAIRFSKGYKPLVFGYVPDWLPPHPQPWKEYGLHDSPVAPWERSSPWTDEMELAVFGYDGRNPEDWPDVWDCKAEVKRREAAERARKQAEADAAELEEV